MSTAKFNSCQIFCLYVAQGARPSYPQQQVAVSTCFTISNLIFGQKSLALVGAINCSYKCDPGQKLCHFSRNKFWEFCDYEVVSKGCMYHYGCFWNFVNEKYFLHIFANILVKNFGSSCTTPLKPSTFHKCFCGVECINLLIR